MLVAVRLQDKCSNTATQGCAYVFEHILIVASTSIKKPAQFCWYSSVDETTLFGGYVELAGFKVRMADHSD